MQAQQKETKYTKLFVGGLPYHTTDAALKEYFFQFGDIDEAVVIHDKVTKKSKGYGFVSFVPRTRNRAVASRSDPWTAAEPLLLSRTLLPLSCRWRWRIGMELIGRSKTRIRWSTGEEPT